MSSGDYQQASPQAVDYIDFGLRNGIAATRMLVLFREHGHAMRTTDFMALWRQRRSQHARAVSA